MHGTSTMLTRLNNDTRQHHVQADRAWLALLSSDVRREDYIRQLTMTYGFEAPVEGALAYTKGLGDVARLRDRSRSGLIAQDLLVLGLTPLQITQLPQCFTITTFRDLTDALGWMYLVERFTLLHMQIRRNLLTRVPGARHACAYLAAYDSVAAARWGRLGAAMERVAGAAAAADQIAEAAEQAFRSWTDWIDTHQRALQSTG